MNRATTTQPPPTIFWFRQDLRLDDLPGLAAAAANGPVCALYILDDANPGERALGGASRWWLHHSLAALGDAIGARGGGLGIQRGDPLHILPQLAREMGASAVHCSRCGEPWAGELERRLHGELARAGVELRRFPGSLLFEPEQVRTQSGGPFKVFTPFWRSCLANAAVPAPRDLPDDIEFLPPGWGGTPAGAAALDALALLPRSPPLSKDWAAHWTSLWQPGSAGARVRLDAFLGDGAGAGIDAGTGPGIADYAEGRDHPARPCTSRLSPHLHFGELSPRQLWHRMVDHKAANPAQAAAVDKFLAELGWREFSHHLLHHYPHIPERAFRPAYDNFPWLGGRELLRAWQRGQTGYPIVDAGMRELWHTGYMHNRVRMIVASFLTKHLLISWREGERWFWDTLVDADLANNVCGWQWVAGSGADAAPYFRIFNPTLQGRKFDAGGDYVRRWVPELAALPDRHLHEPAAAPAGVLAEAGVELGRDYPHPIVDHRQAREAALAAHASLGGGA